MLADVKAVSFDFYGTLAFPRDGRGRGAMVMAYLEAQGLPSDPWEHQVLYDLFARHYRPPGVSRGERSRSTRDLARDLFRRLRVRAPIAAADAHAEALWELLGPTSLELFPEVVRTVGLLERAGYGLAVVSNWQHGLADFCRALGLECFPHVLASAEVGSAKPDGGIFREAARRLGRPPGQILHVGDTMLDDVEGGTAAGFVAVHLRRDSEAEEDPRVTTIAALDAVPRLLGVR